MEMWPCTSQNSTQQRQTPSSSTTRNSAAPSRSQAVNVPRLCYLTVIIAANVTCSRVSREALLEHLQSMSFIGAGIKMRTHRWVQVATADISGNLQGGRQPECCYDCPNFL